MVSLEEYKKLVEDRPEKFTAEEVGYQQAPLGSAMACNSCLHYFRRGVDGFTVCEIFRDEETDSEGVKPNWRCGFYTTDGDSHPLLESE